MRKLTFIFIIAIVLSTAGCVSAPKAKSAECRYIDSTRETVSRLDNILDAVRADNSSVGAVDTGKRRITALKNSVSSQAPPSGMESIRTYMDSIFEDWLVILDSTKDEATRLERLDAFSAKSLQLRFALDEATIQYTCR